MSTSAGGDSGEEDSEELALFRQQWRQELGIIPNPPPSHAEPEEEVIKLSRRHITAHNISSASCSVHPFTNCDDSVWYYITVITVLIAATGIVTCIRWMYGLGCGCGLSYLQ